MQAPGRHIGHRDREASRRSFGPESCKAPDGAGAERVLPQREDQSNPARTRQKGRKVRNRRTPAQDRNGRYAEGRTGESAAGTEAARNDAAYVRRIHGLAKLSRL